MAQEQETSPGAPTLESLAADLARSYRTLEPQRPPRELLPGLDLEGAYEIQSLQRRALVAAGHPVVGHKIGLTSLAMQRQIGVDSPDFGFVSDAQVLAADQPIRVADYLAPKIEPELAFVLAADMGSGTTLDSAAAGISSVHRAVELVDSRVENWDITLVDTVADNASCGAIIVDPQPLSFGGRDVAAAFGTQPGPLTDIAVKLSANGEEFSSGRGADVLGHPLLPLVWLANFLGEHGSELKAGEIVLTGSFCAAVPLQAGMKIRADYGSYGALDIECV